ncbi:MAG TPA: trigger factor [Gammaproteobacteria bacterium]|jgi:trigger factor|nr:trigger factor [Gammaproteobacteria bacterium]
MQVSVEKVSDVLRRITIMVPADLLEKAYEKKIGELAKSAAVQGFRPGKAPIAHVKSRYGKEAREDAANDLMSEAFRSALKEHSLAPLNRPTFELKPTDNQQMLTFTASFEVFPEIPEIHFAMDNIEKLKVDISDEDVTYAVGRLQKQHCEWDVVERAAQLGDSLVFDYVMKVDGVAHHTQEDAHVELGSQMLLPELEAALVGVKINESRVVDLTLPDDFPLEDKRGKAATFEVKVLQVLSSKLPELDAAFAKKLGVVSGDISEFKREVRESLERERDQLVKNKVKQQVFDKLLTSNPIEVPTVFVAEEEKALHDEMYPHEHNHHAHTENELNAFRDIATRRVRLSLLLSEYARRHALEVSEDRLNSRIAEIASAYEHSDEVIKWLSTGKQLSSMKGQLMEDITIDKLIENIPVIEKVTSFSELKGLNVS